GTLDGRMDLVPLKDGLSLSLNLKVRQVGVENVLKALKAKEGLEGKVDVDIELSGQGRSIASLMSGLNGKTVIVSGNGRIKNEYIEVLGSDFATGAFRLINPFKEKTEYTPFNCFVSGFSVKDGLAEITALVMDTDQTTVIGQGRVNLKNEELDVALKPSPKKGLQTGIFGKLSLSFGELAKPVKLGGTLANPSLTLDPALTALALGKAVGGVILFGPLGIAAALAGRSSGEENPCLSAIEAAQKGIKVSEDKQAEEKKKPEEKKESAEKPSEGIKGVFEGIGSSIKKLFGD
ncbi:MAG: AsmA-like C-terminal region-containing protein, partial [Desulfobacterales bacterium]|nr:AsmA-like C-terminal region-containing protein [Desulfobacterales bacterium]